MKNNQNQGNTRKTNGPPKNYKTHLNINKNADLGEPGDGGGFGIWPYRALWWECKGIYDQKVVVGKQINMFENFKP